MFADGVCGLRGTSYGEKGWKDYVQSVSCLLPVGVNDEEDVGDLKKQTREPTRDEKEEYNISPYIAYDDGYVWPDLWTEVDEMMETSILIFPLVELRRKARAKELEATSAERIMCLPLTHTDVMDIVMANKEAILNTKLTEEFYLQTLQAAQARPALSRAVIVAVDDEFEKEELVYSVQVNNLRKRITVCFRGSATKADWATNFEIYFKEVSNPMKAHNSQEDTVRVHNGFHDYLMEPNSRGVTGPNGELLSEYQEILHHHVLPILNEYPGYKLYVTGHSLGSALATLFSFFAATEPDDVVPKPVSLFSIGGPYVGDSSFRSAHQLLEGLGKLRHLRVSNHKDLATAVPKISFRLNIFDRSSHVGAFFKHVGMNLRLYEGPRSMEISYPSVRTGYFSSTFEELGRGWDQSFFANWSWNPLDLLTWPAHSIKEYAERLDANKPSLQTLELNSLYSRKDIVGNLLAEF